MILASGSTHTDDCSLSAENCTRNGNMEGKRPKRPISATVTSSSNSRTPFTRYAPQAPTGSGSGQPPPTTTAVEPPIAPRLTAAAVPQKGPRSIAQLKNLSQQEISALVRGNRDQKPQLQRARSFPSQAPDADEDHQMQELMRELRQCRYLRTSQEDAEENGND